MTGPPESGEPTESNKSESTETTEVDFDPAAASAGLDTPADRRHEDAARDLAKWLLGGAGVITAMLIIAATLVVLKAPGADATALLAFFGSIVSALGTLLGGVVGYYFGKHRNN